MCIKTLSNYFKSKQLGNDKVITSEVIIKLQNEGNKPTMSFAFQ
jgi:hypothetical protein